MQEGSTVQHEQTVEQKLCWSLAEMLHTTGMGVLHVTAKCKAASKTTFGCLAGNSSVENCIKDMICMSVMTVSVVTTGQCLPFEVSEAEPACPALVLLVENAMNDCLSIPALHKS